MKNMGKTILISSHILSELAEMCTVIGIIDKGRMSVSGSVEEITEKLTRTGKLKIKVRDRLEQAVKLLQEQPSIGEIAINGDTVEADTGADEQVLSDILKRLVMQDIPVVSFARTGGSLESVFMQLTEGSDGHDA